MVSMKRIATGLSMGLVMDNGGVAVTGGEVPVKTNVQHAPEEPSDCVGCLINLLDFIVDLFNCLGGDN